MNQKANNVVRIPSSLEKNFFKFWLSFLVPFHNLTKREMDVATAFLQERFELSKDIINDELLDKIVMSDETKAKIRTNTNLSTAHFQMILGKLKKNKFIIDNKINPRFIPKNLKPEDKAFQLLLYFDLS